jgi:hypothetical protein
VRWPFRRDALPAAVRASLRLQHGERTLDWADGPAGWVVATTHALWVPGRSGLERIGWDEVDTATWGQDEGVLTVVQAAPLGGRARRRVLRLRDGADLLLVVKERVRATMVLSRRIDLGGGPGVAIVARRPPGSDTLAWTVSVDGGVDVSDLRVRGVIEDALREMKAQVGA